MRLTDVAAAIGRAQLRRLRAWNERRRANAARLTRVPARAWSRTERSRRLPARLPPVHGPRHRSRRPAGPPVGARHRQRGLLPDADPPPPALPDRSAAPGSALGAPGDGPGRRRGAVPAGPPRSERGCVAAGRRRRQRLGEPALSAGRVAHRPDRARSHGPQPPSRPGRAAGHGARRRRGPGTGRRRDCHRACRSCGRSRSWWPAVSTTPSSPAPPRCMRRSDSCWPRPASTPCSRSRSRTPSKRLSGCRMRSVRAASSPGSATSSATTRRCRTCASGWPPAAWARSIRWSPDARGPSRPASPTSAW